MFDLGLEPDVFDALVSSLAGSEQIRTRVFLLDLEHNVVQDLSHLGPDGSTSINGGADIQSSASCSLFDPLGESGLDVVTDVAGVRPPDRMLQVYRSSMVNGTWIDIPVFCGVIVDVSRDGDYLSIEAQSKDVLALDKPWRAYTVKKGTLVTEAVRLILANMTGETRFKIQANSKKLAKDISVGSDTTPLETVKMLLDGIGYVSFYDAEGWFVAKPVSNDVGFIIRDGDGGLVTSRVTRDYRSEGIVNAVRVTSANGKNKAEAVADVNHPFAPLKLGRNGVGRFLWEDIQSESNLSKAQCQSQANEKLAELLLDAVSVSFEGLPVPFLDAWDVVRVEADSVAVDVRFTQMSVPWGLGLSSYGFLPRVKARKR